MADLDLSVLNITTILLLGLLAGTLGGMLGVGGSVILIPGLVILFGQARAATPNLNQHIYQAAAMIANIAVSVPAAVRHHKAGATHLPAIRWILPSAMVFVIVGVSLSNLFQGTSGAIWLGRCLAVLLIYVVYVNVRRLSGAAQKAEDAAHPRVSPLRSAAVGAVMGLIAGLTGVGGGAIAVPLQQVLLRLPLRNCIANSSAVICVSALVGALYKNATLATLGFDVRVSLTLALLVAPTCWLGGHLGAILTHQLPVRTIRIAFIGLMLVAIWKMTALG
ncbi:MAG: sulfite exporter TauE/SafE family protein [Phycisphaeraceae bacterium]